MTKKIFILLAFFSFSAATLSAQRVKPKAKPTPAPVIPEVGVLINGVVWASRNVDAPGTFAATPESPGMFYQWNCKVGWRSSIPVKNSKGDAKWNSSAAIYTTWRESCDPSPAGWRLPTRAELEKLLETAKVDSKWTIRNGVNGRKFTDKTTGASIFLPAAGYRDYYIGTLYGAGMGGYYWSSMRDDRYGAYYMGFSSGGVNWSYDSRVFGFSVRSVAK